MSDLLMLAERCESADGPDREIDVRISLSLKGEMYSDWLVAENLRYRDEPTGYGRYRPADEWVPKYTESLDAAMTLIIEERDFVLSSDVQNDEATASCGFIDGRGLGYVERTAKTAVLALCAAALRARAAA